MQDLFVPDDAVLGTCVVGGASLASLGMAQQLIADNKIEITAWRALLRETSAKVACGARSTEESPRVKVFVSETVERIIAARR
jgi:acyl-CoA dehydrogenase